jgi:hypothetical protein
MNLPYRFPDPQEEARRRAQEFQQLSSSQRWQELAAVMAFGWKMVAMSPQRQAIERRMEEQEAEAQRIQKELFQRYAR